MQGRKWSTGLFGGVALPVLFCAIAPRAMGQDLIMADEAVWNTCDGTFYDSGGGSGAYGNNQDLVATLCPGSGANSGAATAVEFLVFQAGSMLDPGDQLSIHDGIGTAAPIIATGNYDNSLAGLTFIADGPTGCLTFHWTSSVFGNAPGWVAEVITGPDAGDNASLTLCGSQPPFLLFDVLNGDPDVGGMWSGPSGPHSPLYDPATDVSGVYTYIVIDGGLCRDSAIVTIANLGTADPGEDGSLLLCNTSPPVQLINSLGGTPSSGGTWTGPGGPHDGNFDPVNDAEGDYTYTVGGNAPCPSASATVAVSVTGLANAGTDGTLTVCDTVAALDLFDALGGTPDGGGAWLDLDGSGALNDGILNTVDLPAGNYAFRYTVAVPGCGSDNALVEVEVLGGVSTTGLIRECAETNGLSIISFTIVGGSAGTYTVQGIAGTIDPAPPYLFVSEPVPDTLAFTLVVADENGCGPATIQVAPCTYTPHVFIPESFSPNGDGVNETFVIPGLEDYPGNELCIFNRWGTAVYRVMDYHETYKAWKGSVDNKSVHDLLPSGTYYYVLDLGDGSELRKGFIYLNH